MLDFFESFNKEPIIKDIDLYTHILGIRLPWFIVKVNLSKEKNRVDVYLEHESEFSFPCPECDNLCPVYDHQESESVWQHLDTCQLKTYIHCRLPRIRCKKHGVKLILSEHAEQNSNKTILFEGYIIDLERECNLSAVSRIAGITWDVAKGIMNRAVERGLKRKPKIIPLKIGVDEKAIKKGHNYETIVCNQETGYVEDVLEDRKKSSLEEYYKKYSPEELATVKSVSMDMWEPFILATKAYIPNAGEKIVFDRYHVTSYIQKAVDNVRKEEHAELQKQGHDLLKGTKYLWLRNNENVPAFNREVFDTLRGMDLKVGRAWQIKENFRLFWSYNSRGWAEKFFKKWYYWATHSRLKPMVKAAKTIKNHINNIMTYFTHKVTNGLSEGLNSHIEKIKRMAYGFRNRENYKKAILFHCGGLDLYPRKGR